MRIHRPVIVEQDGEIRVSARVDIDTPCNREFAPDLWFSVPLSQRDFLTDRADGFAAALLPLAMFLGEPLEFEGVVSPRLLRGMDDYQQIQSRWQPGLFEVVSIVPEVVAEPRTEEVAGGVACAFSGGVDSFHTLYRHMPENEPVDSYRLTHCLMINGFGSDLDRDDGRAFRRIVAAYEPMMERIGVQPLVTRTNISELWDLNLLKGGFAAVITGTALVMGRLLSRLFIPSSYRFDDGLPEGSHVMLEHLLGTDTLEVIHDAPHRRRSEKTRTLAEWSETYDTLRVCWQGTRLAREDRRIENCCRCEKCIRTMVTLQLAGALDRYSVFPHGLRRRDIWRLQHRKRGKWIFVRDIVREAWRSRHPMVIFHYGVSLLGSLLGMVFYELPRAVHLFIERHWEAYARLMERHHPHLKGGMRLLRKIER